MAEYPPDTTNIPLPVYGQKDATTAAAVDSPENLEAITGIQSDGSDDNLHKKAGIAVIQQQHTIPPTGKRMPTSKWEYIFFCIFCEYYFVYIYIYNIAFVNCARTLLIETH